MTEWQIFVLGAMLGVMISQLGVLISEVKAVRRLLERQFQ